MSTQKNIVVPFSNLQNVPLMCRVINSVRLKDKVLEADLYKFFLRRVGARKSTGAFMALDYRGTTFLGILLYRLYAGNEILVVDLAVKPSRQREGIGSLLVSEIINKARELRRKFVRFVILEENEEAQLFLRAMGFDFKKRVKGRHNRYYYVFVYRL